MSAEATVQPYEDSQRRAASDRVRHSVSFTQHADRRHSTSATVTHRVLRGVPSEVQLTGVSWPTVTTQTQIDSSSFADVSKLPASMWGRPVHGAGVVDVSTLPTMDGRVFVIPQSRTARFPTTTAATRVPQCLSTSPTLAATPIVNPVTPCLC